MLKEKIIKKLEEMYFGPYVLNSIVESISVDSVVLQPILTIKNTHAGYYIENHEFSDQYIEEIEEFKWKKEENEYYMEIKFEDGLLTMITQEEYGDSIQWLKVKFAIIEKE